MSYFMMSSVSRRTIGKRHAQTGGGGSSTDLLTLNAANSGVTGYRYWDYQSNFIGGYLLPTSASGDATYGMVYTGDSHRIGIGSTANTIYATGNNNGDGGSHYYAEFNVPAIVPGTDINAYNYGTFSQNYRRLDTDFIPPYGDHVVAVPSYDSVTGKLFVPSYSYYPATFEPECWAEYSDATDLAGSTKTGLYAAGGAATACHQLIPLPAEWQAAEKFNRTHFMMGGYGNIALSGRVSMGPSIWRANAATLSSGGADQITGYPIDTPLNGTQSGLNNDQIWNFISRIAGGWIVPNTSTLMFVGCNLNKRAPYNLPPGDHIIYGASNLNDIGVGVQGYQPYYHQGWSNYYWLFDLYDLLACYLNPVTNPPHMVQPYEHGFMDGIALSAYNKLIRGASFDSRNNRVTFSIENGANPREAEPSPAFVCYSLEVA